MNIRIKVLNAPEECMVEVTESTTVLEMKKQIEQNLNIPVAYQKIFILGRVLVDENTIGTYPTIKDGTKLRMVVKKPDPLKDMLFRSFRKYYNEQLSQALCDEFMQDFEKRMKQFSLDDIERIASGLD